MSQQDKDKLQRLYKRLTKLENDYDDIEEFEDIAYLDQQIEELVDEISSIEARLSSLS